jgi:hypothetical protein
MRWSMWPVSISVHVLVVITVLMVPLTAEVEWPAPAPLHRLMVATKVVPVPDSVTPILPTTRPVPVLPDVTAANTLDAPRDVPTPFVGPVVPSLASTGTGAIDPSLLGPRRDRSRRLRRPSSASARASANQNELPAHLRNTPCSRAARAFRGSLSLKR